MNEWDSLKITQRKLVMPVFDFGTETLISMLVGSQEA